MARVMGAIGALALLSLMGGTALAGSVVESDSVILNNQTGMSNGSIGYQDSSSASLNGDTISSYYSSSYSTVSRGDVLNMGAAFNAQAGTSPGALGPIGHTETTSEDFWYLTCASSAPCETVSSPIPVTLIGTISGVVSAAPSITNDSQGGLFQASYGYENYGPAPSNLGFQLDIWQSNDPQDQNSDSVPGLSGSFSYCAATGSGSCVEEQEPVEFTPIGDGNYSFSVSYDESGEACVIASEEYCQISPEECLEDDAACAPVPMFVSYQDIYAVFGAGYTAFLDALDPFSTEFISDDPDYRFVTDNGLVSGTVSAPSTSVAEPGSLGVLAAGMAFLALVLRQRRFTARAADDGSDRRGIAH